MAWTAPRTWVAGEKPSASTLNTHIRDNLLMLSNAWTAWTPSWTATTTNPVIGNGTITGGKMEIGKWVRAWAEIVMGSTTTYGSGNWQLNTPLTESAHRWSPRGVGRDDSATSSYDMLGERTASGVLTLRCEPTTAGNALRTVTSTSPFTWATSDSMFVFYEYEAA